MLIQLKKLREDATIPTRGSIKAAGYDIYSAEEYKVAPGQTVKVGTGIAVAIPDGYFGGIYARSGLSTKEGLRPANCVGVIDSDYRGELIVSLHNDSDVERLVEKGQRIAQLVVQPYLSVEFETVDELDETERGEGGFGHSGKK